MDQRGGCAAYILSGVVIALLIPVDFAIENHVAFDFRILPRGSSNDVDPRKAAIADYLLPDDFCVRAVFPGARQDADRRRQKNF